MPASAPRFACPPEGDPGRLQSISICPSACSGAMAEDAGWRIARALTDKGAWAEIKVTSPDYVRLSRFLCPPASVGDGSCTLPEFATAA